LQKGEKCELIMKGELRRENREIKGLSCKKGAA